MRARYIITDIGKARVGSDHIGLVLALVCASLSKGVTASEMREWITRRCTRASLIRPSGSMVELMVFYAPIVFGLEKYLEHCLARGLIAEADHYTLEQRLWYQF